MPKEIKKVRGAARIYGEKPLFLPKNGRKNAQKDVKNSIKITTDTPKCL